MLSDSSLLSGQRIERVKRGKKIRPVVGVSLEHTENGKVIIQIDGATMTISLENEKEISVSSRTSPSGASK